MTQFLVGITAAQALHTWQYADKTRLSQMGSTASLSLAQRKEREANRKTVGTYHTSKVATVATTMRGDVARFTKKERAKIDSRIDRMKSEHTPQLPTPQARERPMPDAGVYRRPNL